MDFAILPFERNRRNADLNRKAFESAFSIPSFESKPKAGRMGNFVSNFEIGTGENILLTPLYPEKDMVYARFFRPDDKTTNAYLNFKMGNNSIVETDFDGEILRNINGKINFNPWEIRTLRMQIK